MKRNVPLLITAFGGFVLIVAYFIPATQGWGEVAAIWFDILAAIAFILGGGNLLKIHLKKVSDRAAGWGYSVITILAFLIMLYVGLVKWGSPPAPVQEFYGRTFVSLPLSEIPVIFTVPGEIHEKASGERIHASVRRQISEENGNIVFRGWMRADQFARLIDYEDDLEWRCTIEKLYRDSSAGIPVAYFADHDALSFTGHMTAEHRDTLLAMGSNQSWIDAVQELYEKSQAVHSVAITAALPLPPRFDHDDFDDAIEHSGGDRTLAVKGPMTPAQKSRLTSLYPRARPLDDQQRERLLAQLRTLGPLTDTHVEAFHKVFDGVWTVDQLHTTLNAAGKAQEIDKSWCELYDEQRQGVEHLEQKKTVGEDQHLNADQLAVLDAFAADMDISVDALIAGLKDAGPFNDAQADALRNFMKTVPTEAALHKQLAIAMMKAADENGVTTALNEDQRDLLFADYRHQVEWTRLIDALYLNAHTVKYPWSGEYRAQGAPFWWLYEYAFKPLQATIFAMLAFYVASAAFRAFRAKNFEAILLLGTAFIILLGRTFAGVLITDWLPEAPSENPSFFQQLMHYLRIENMTVYIMQVFNTAGNRAIMIGIALGIASTSLKVLLGVDRSYLGSGD